MRRLTLDIAEEMARLNRANARLLAAVKKSREEYADMLEISHASIEALLRRIGSLEEENRALRLAAR